MFNECQQSFTATNSHWTYIDLKSNGYYHEKPCCAFSDSCPALQLCASIHWCHVNWQHALCQPVRWQSTTLYAVVVLHNSTMHPIVAFHSAGIFRAVLAVVFVHSFCVQTKHTLMSKPRACSGGMCYQCLTALMTLSLFHHCWRHTKQGYLH